MKETLNYKLKKPEGTDIVNVEDLNFNADIIDTQLKERDTRVGPLTSLATRIKTSIVNALNGLQADFNEHKAEMATQDTAGHIKLSDVPTPTKSAIGLGNVDNIKQMPISGGTFTGDVSHNRNYVNQPRIKDYSEVVEIATGVTGARIINLGNGNVFRHTLSGATTYTFSNSSPSGQCHSFTLIVQQPATAVAITFPASVKWANDEIPPAPKASKVAVYTFFTTDGGSRWYGSQAMNEVTP